MRQFTSVRLTLVLLVIAGCHTANAEMPGCHAWRSAEVPGEVVGVDKAVILSTPEVCHGGAGCQAGHASYVLPGDQVVIGTVSPNDFVCVGYSDGKHYTEGWLPAGRVLRMPLPETWPLTAWTGHWMASQTDVGDTSIDLGMENEGIYASGIAVNGGGRGDHVGDLEGTGKPVGNRLTVSHDTCTVTMTLLGHYLMVEDPGGCGPANGGNFTGLYVRKIKIGQ